MARTAIVLKGEEDDGAMSHASLRKYQASFWLKRLPKKLASDIISDGRISEKFGISTHRPIKFGASFEADQDDVLAAIRAALENRVPQEIRDTAGRSVKAHVELGAGHQALVVVGRTKYAFPHASLLSSTPPIREKFLEDYYKENTISKKFKKEIGGSIDQSLRDNATFLKVIELLDISPEAYQRRVNEKIDARQMTDMELFTVDVRHWENLIAPHLISSTLESFISAELELERTNAMASNVVRATSSMSLSFVAPELVPVAKFADHPVDTILAALQQISEFTDHFALTGAFEICANQLPRDDRFREVGATILKQLIGDMRTLKRNCNFYSAAFAGSLAYLAQHETLKKKPAYWRRLAAATHSSLVVRSCKPSNVEKLWIDFSHRYGKAFYFSVLLDSFDEPSWKPEWLGANHLVADSVDRINTAIKALSVEAIPNEWSDLISVANLWVDENKIRSLGRLPAAVQCSRRKLITGSDAQIVNGALAELLSNPSLQLLLKHGGLTFFWGATDALIAACQRLARQLQSLDFKWSSADHRNCVAILSYVAAQSRDRLISEQVTECCLRAAPEVLDQSEMLELVARLIECSATDLDHEARAQSLAQRLEVIACHARPEVLGDLSDSLRHLSRLDDALGQKLGRAIAASQLGRQAA